MRVPRTRPTILILATLLAVGVLVPAAAARTESPPPRLADRDANGLSDDLQSRLANARPGARLAVIVTFDGPGGVASSRAAVGPFQVTRRFALIHGFAATMTRSQTEALAAVPGVFRVEEDFAVEVTMDSADRDFGTEAARTEYGVDGAGVEICVVDTGVDIAHEQLDSKTSLGSSSVAFFDAVNGRSAPYDDHGHGTHVASIALGDGSGGPNAGRFGGVAPGASLSAAKVLNSSGSGSASGVIAGIDWCAGRSNVRVISMSLGSSTPSDGSDSISQAVNNAVGLGKVVAVAAGNSGDGPSTIGSPGAASGALTVGAVSEWSAAPGEANHSDGIYLAPFSSRGPTLAGTTKPDVVAPGVTITAAQVGTTSSYATYSGTSMATPFVSGTVALALERHPSWGPGDVRTTIEGAAQDRGPVGKDSDWGAGLLDGYAAVGGVGSTSFPTNVRVPGSVADHGTWTHSFTLGSDDLGIPIAATMIIDGGPVCVLGFGGFCLQYNWGPDLDAELLDPSGTLLARSTCSDGSECGIGRQETLHAMPTTAGSYTIRVYPFEGSPFYGDGGSFSIDLSTGPVGSGGGSGGGGGGGGGVVDPPASHVGDLDASAERSGSRRWWATVTVTVHDGDEATLADAVVTGTWQGGATGTCTADADGSCSISRRFSRNVSSREFTVTAVELSGYGYVPGANHDEESDSNGTRITVISPL
jgi:serine protease AprX